ncbi:hypothetical protein [Methylocystis sp. Sn-Cys]|uniref:hypothetical protein n=1 Tax=Methylocystis sp. Sn-Cys TaxID=1701263 RepID=UPI00351CA70A
MIRNALARFALANCALFVLCAPAPAKDERVWTLSGLEEKKPDLIYLNYGVPETDDSFGAFRCKPKSGDVTFFVSETSEKLKPGKSATAALSIGEVQTKIAGKLLPNEEAGVPSFEGRLPANDPIFEAMATGETLAAIIGPSKQTAPLKGAAEKVKKFIAACAKP